MADDMAAFIAARLDGEAHLDRAVQLILNRHAALCGLRERGDQAAAVLVREYEDYVLPNLGGIWNGHPGYAAACQAASAAWSRGTVR